MPTGRAVSCAEVGLDLGGLAMADARVDEQRRLVAEHDADVLVVELVPRHEHAVADFGPGAHAAQRSGSRVLGSNEPNIASGERISAESVARPQTRGT